MDPFSEFTSVAKSQSNEPRKDDGFGDFADFDDFSSFKKEEKKTSSVLVSEPVKKETHEDIFDSNSLKKISNDLHN